MRLAIEIIQEMPVERKRMFFSGNILARQAPLEVLFVVRNFNICIPSDSFRSSIGSTAMTVVSKISSEILKKKEKVPS
jgi:hypothetical protein